MISHREGLEIADVACGNAVWTMDMAVAFPHARITGLDISPHQFPQQFTWPRNVSLELCNIFQPLPDHYVARFDVVHVRLIMAAVYFQNKDWVMQNIVQMLKPGGWIQWTDVTVPVLQALGDASRGRSVFRDPPAITIHLSNFFACTEWLRRLPEELQRHGLVNLQNIDISAVPWLSKQETDNAIWALNDVHEGLKARAPKDVFEPFGNAVQETLEDIRRGRVFYITYYTTIGQRAS